MLPDPFPGPLSPEIRDDPYPCYRWLLDDRPVYHDPRAGYWALSRHADVVAAARDYQTFSSAEGIGLTPSKGRTIMSTDPPDHTRLRKLMTRAFQPAVVEALAPRVEAICHELIDGSAVARGTFDLIEDFAFPLPVIVIAELLGLDPKRRDEYRRWSRALVDMFSNPTSLAALHAYPHLGCRGFARSRPRQDRRSGVSRRSDQRVADG
jgi:cytochrome P450